MQNYNVILKSTTAKLMAFLIITGANCSNVALKKRTSAIEVRSSSSSSGENYYRVYHWNNLTMYESQYRFRSRESHLQIDSTSGQMRSVDTLVLSETRVKYFVYHRDSSYGYSYDPNKKYDGLRIKVDSAVQLITGTNTFENILALKPDSVIWNKNRTLLKEVYAFPSSEDAPSSRWTFWYSKKMNKIGETFSRILDSVKRMKLYKAEYDGETFYFEKGKVQWPAVKSVTEMKVITIDTPDVVRRYFERYLSGI